MKTELLITFGSWEDRFVLGVEANLRDFNIDGVLGFYFTEYADRTRKARDRIVELCAREDMPLAMLPLEAGSPVGNWRKVVSNVVEGVDRTANGSVLVDISTMPREIIWYICWTLTVNGVAARYVYYSPESYTGSWLSRDPRSPRLVYKLAGVSRPDRRTALLVTMGFDRDRPRRLVRWLEPDRLLFGIQVDSAFERNQKAMRGYRNALTKDYECDVFNLDAFGGDRGRNAIKRALDGLVETHNVVMASLGPKLTAVSLFEIQRETESASLAYAPANQFSEDYSNGIGTRYVGDISGS